MNKLKKVVKNAKNICWYPSARFDIPTTYFINTSSEEEQADLFIFSDHCYRTFSLSEMENYFNFNTENQSWRERFHDKLVERLGIVEIICINLTFIDVIDFGPEITRDGINDGVNSPIYSAEFIINQNTQSEKKINVLLVGCYNEPFCNNFLIKESIEVKCLVYKNPCGYGGFMSGLWIYNTIPILKTYNLATEIGGSFWNTGDDAVILQYPGLGEKVDAPYFSESKQSVFLTVNNKELEFQTISVRELHSNDISPKAMDGDRVISSGFFGINKLI